MEVWRVNINNKKCKAQKGLKYVRSAVLPYIVFLSLTNNCKCEALQWSVFSNTRPGQNCRHYMNLHLLYILYLWKDFHVLIPPQIHSLYPHVCSVLHNTQYQRLCLCNMRIYIVWESTYCYIVTWMSLPCFKGGFAVKSGTFLNLSECSNCYYIFLLQSHFSH